MLVYPETDQARWARMQRFPMRPGDRFWNFSGGGGGYGDPLGRDPSKVVADVMDGYVSHEAAREVYGVIVDERGDHEPTKARLRYEQAASTAAANGTDRGSG